MINVIKVIILHYGNKINNFLKYVQKIFRNEYLLVYIQCRAEKKCIGGCVYEA